MTTETKNTEHMDEADCIQFVGSLIASHAFRFSSEYELQCKRVIKFHPK